MGFRFRAGGVGGFRVSGSWASGVQCGGFGNSDDATMLR